MGGQNEVVCQCSVLVCYVSKGFQTTACGIMMMEDERLVRER